MSTIGQNNQIARINRQLAKRGEKLRTSRIWGEKHNLGELSHHRRVPERSVA